MPKITWSEKLEIGIDSIDEQHRRIIDLINELQDHIERGELVLANQTLHTLIEYKTFHCAHEEELLQQAGFPLLKPHKRAHSEYIKECRVFHRRAEQGEYVAHKALAFVKPWMVKHIRGEDMDYAEYVKRHHASGEPSQLPWHLRTLNRFFPNKEK